MPSKTARQRRFMAMCAHNPQHAKGKCPSKSVAAEFAHADARAGRHDAVQAKLKGGG